MTLIHFIRQHKRKLIVTGAAMVFFTYITKDGLRDSAKARVDELEKVEASYQQAIEHNQDMTTILGLYSAVEALSYPNKGTKGFTPESVFEAEDQRSHIRQIGGVLAIVDELKASVPYNPQIDELRKDAEEKFTLLFAAQVRLSDEFESAEKQNRDQAPESEKAAMENARRAHEEAWLAVVNLSETTFHDAEIESAKRQKVYHIFSWLSYGFYIVGWAIGVVGEFAKEEKPTSPPSTGYDPEYDPIGS